MEQNIFQISNQTKNPQTDNSYELVALGVPKENQCNDEINCKRKMTYDNGDTYDGEWLDDKKYGKGKMTYDNGDIYDGEWKDDLKYGKGKMTYDNGDTYDGEWKDDKRNGQGTEIFSDGDVYVGAFKDVYVGEFKDDKRNGQGKFSWKSGHFYDGGWKDDEMNGLGRMMYSNYDTYDGEWKGGKKHGKGSLSCKGFFYEGQFLDDKMNGRGKLCRNGNVFVGEFKDNKMNGQAIAILDNGNRYEGQLINNIKQGQGTFSWKSGHCYEGEWRDNKQNGQGKMTYPNGDIYNGEWKNDLKNGKGIMFDDGGKYEGEFKDNKKNGQGRMRYGYGFAHVYEGQWKDDKQNGRGKLCRNGNAYEGEFKDNKKNGQGIMKFSNGYIYDGEWKDSKKHGIGIFVNNEGTIMGSATYYENGAINDIKNLRYVLISEVNKYHFFYQEGAEIYYQELPILDNKKILDKKEDLEKIYEAKAGKKVDIKFSKRLPEFLMQLCSSETDIHDKDFKKVRDSQDFAKYINEIKEESTKGKAVIRNIEIPGHTFVALAEKRKVVIYDNGGLTNQCHKAYYNFINRNCYKYQLIDSNDELKFKANNETFAVNFEHLTPDGIDCRHISNIVSLKLKEIQKAIEKKESGKLIKDGYNEYLYKNSYYQNLHSEDEGGPLQKIQNPIFIIEKPKKEISKI